ncbi:hypothetical protein [Dehalobacter sp. DCM]
MVSARVNHGTCPCDYPGSIMVPVPVITGNQAIKGTGTVIGKC